jgi:hypothetical protein
VYFYAQSKGRKELIEKQNEIIVVQREELRDWQNKALFRNNLSPLGRETEPSKPKDPNAVNGTPRVAMRAQRQARAEGHNGSAITIHAEEIVNPRTQDTVEKAKGIIRQSEIDAE